MTISASRSDAMESEEIAFVHDVFRASESRLRAAKTVATQIPTKPTMTRAVTERAMRRISSTALAEYGDLRSIIETPPKTFASLDIPRKGHSAKLTDPQYDVRPSEATAASRHRGPGADNWILRHGRKKRHVAVAPLRAWWQAQCNGRRSMSLNREYRRRHNINGRVLRRERR